MKIAFIGQKGLPASYGGVERHVEELATRLVKAGQEVIVYSRKWYTKVQDDNYQGVKIKHLPSIHTKHLDTITHVFISTIHAIFSGAQVIHYHGIGPALLSWLPRILAPKTLVIVTFHSIDRYDQKWGWIAKIILRLAEKSACKFPHQTIVISRGLQKYCLNEFNCETIYIPNGITLPEKQNDNSEFVKFGLKPQEYLIMVSRLIPTKGAHILIEAFNELKRKNYNNEKIQKLKLAIVGGSVYTNDYVKKLHLLASHNNDIIFTDFQTDSTLHALHSNALALVHPSFNEGLPLTVLEGMSYALPTLVSDIAEHYELITNKNFIFKENNISDLEEKLLSFLNTTPEEKQQAGIANRNFVTKNYLWDNIVPQVLEVYLKSTTHTNNINNPIKVNIGS
ncbi:MAG: Glycosyltransferase [Candidatus Magasanikbacteria bacterium GW2011_GWC2_37_14]|uniref:Glycosyltransferase n=1 Tax=Candidatus Magasanikbacteria bacterium GW2011_GWC2_37_14 TaxID=1619046 RepID=A0A0G0GB77_9BACT|nr:MAG: Glycosyltransferase [Candidatus Magasanikbacteria bacterium GW2011_GWC2_37_14]